MKTKPMTTDECLKWLGSRFEDVIVEWATDLRQCIAKAENEQYVVEEFEATGRTPLAALRKLVAAVKKTT